LAHRDRRRTHQGTSGAPSGSDSIAARLFLRIAARLFLRIAARLFLRIAARLFLRIAARLFPRFVARLFPPLCLEKSTKGLIAHGP